jgi:hypothetical protein
MLSINSRFKYKKNYSIDDLMGGEGLFVGGSISAFTLASNHDYHFINWNGSNVLR